MASPTASEVDKEENELNKSIDEYADLSMDADMVEDDDLLDENFETVENFESPDNENTEEAEKEDGSSLPEYPEEQRVIKAELIREDREALTSGVQQPHGNSQTEGGCLQSQNS
ncbi:hypothetical protein YC2023_004781 [Brassica napus]